MTDLQRDFIGRYLYETAEIVNSLNKNDILRVSERLKRVKRLFILGVGGSAGTASHAVNDFRKIAGIEAYAPTDNVSELTARVNDDDWESVFEEWLKTSHLSSDDGILIFSVGGGSVEKNISVNIIRAIKYAKRVGATILGVVGRDGGYTADAADACIIVPTVNPDTITAHTEETQTIILHLLVSSPDVKKFGTKWESTK
jgi:D-sedoheptulose 7-phosphate isomerase